MAFMLLWRWPSRQLALSERRIGENTSYLSDEALSIKSDECAGLFTKQLNRLRFFQQDVQQVMPQKTCALSAMSFGMSLKPNRKWLFARNLCESFVEVAACLPLGIRSAEAREKFEFA